MTYPNKFPKELEWIPNWSIHTGTYIPIKEVARPTITLHIYNKIKFLVWVVKIRPNKVRNDVTNSIYFLFNLFIKLKKIKHPKDFPKNIILPNPPNCLSVKFISFDKSSVVLDKTPWSNSITIGMYTKIMKTIQRILRDNSIGWGGFESRFSFSSIIFWDFASSKLFFKIFNSGCLTSWLIFSSIYLDYII